MSQGPKSLAAPAYYARLTQSLVSALTVPTAQGTLYKVDMRLRPSGKQGPVATSLAGFTKYQRDEAWTWEHLALTRARVVAGAPQVAADLQAAVAHALAVPRDRAKVLDDVHSMRARLAENEPKTAASPWEVKLGAGRMLDLELTLQAGRVLCPDVTAQSPRDMIPALQSCGFLSPDQATLFAQALARLGAIQQIGRLALDDDFAPGKGGAVLARIIAQAGRADDLPALEALLTDQQAQVAEQVARLLDGAGA